MDPGLNQLLKWSVENSTPTSHGITNPTDSSTDLNSTTPDPRSTDTRPARPLDPAMLTALFGGPSDADLLKASMSAILSPDPEITLDDRLVAFDNFEQLIESLDNANNLTPLALWAPLLSCLAHEEGEIRKYAAWCVGTAVQNNEKSQAACVENDGVEKLVKLAVDQQEVSGVRRKAVYALSSAVRNWQPAMDRATKALEERGRDVGKVDAGDMDACDVLIGGLREEVAEAEKKEKEAKAAA